MYRIKLFLFSIILSINTLIAQTEEIGGKYSLKINGTVRSITTDIKGNVYAVGDFQNKLLRNYVVKYDGTKWSEVTGSNVLFAKDVINSIALDNLNNIYIGGKYKDALFNKNFLIHKYDGLNWTVFAGIDTLKLDGEINHILLDNKGNLYTCGSFKNSKKSFYVAKFNGINWTELGGLNSLIQDSIMSNAPKEMCFDKLGNLYVIGLVSKGGNNFFLKKFNGMSWTTILIDTALICCTPNTITSDSKNNIYIPGGVIGNFGKYNVIKYNGVNWTELGGTNSLISYGHIAKIICDKNDNIYATVLDSNLKLYIAKFDGTKWSKYYINYTTDLGIGLTSLCSNSSGNVFTAGDISNDSQYRFVAKLSNSYNTVRLIENEKNKIYPNPCSACELKTEQFLNTKNLFITDILGKKINAQFEKTQNGYSIILPKETKAIYFLHNTETMEILKFIKE